MIYTFKDFYHNTVQLSFDKEPFSKTPKHVWMICRYQNQWLLTEHPTRGIEFPGGKVEPGETAVEAAKREIMEETGGIIKSMDYVAQYFVDGKKDSIIKNVYFAEVKSLTNGHAAFETLGPVLMKQLPGNLKQHDAYSFMMKDDVIVQCLHHLQEKKQLPQA